MVPKIAPMPTSMNVPRSRGDDPRTSVSSQTMAWGLAERKAVRSSLIEIPPPGLPLKKGEEKIGVQREKFVSEWSGPSPYQGEVGWGYCNEVSDQSHPRASRLSRSTPISTRSGVTGVSRRGAIL